MVKKKQKIEKRDEKLSLNLNKDDKRLLKDEQSVTKAAEYIENLMELHKLQGVLLVHLKREFVK